MGQAWPWPSHSADVVLFEAHSYHPKGSLLTQVSTHFLVPVSIIYSEGVPEGVMGEEVFPVRMRSWLPATALDSSDEKRCRWYICTQTPQADKLWVACSALTAQLIMNGSCSPTDLMPVWGSFNLLNHEMQKKMVSWSTWRVMSRHCH